MAPLPEITSATLKAIWASWEDEARSWDSIGISMSDLGSDCDRAIWLSFRWASAAEKLTGAKLRLFKTGHIEEERIIADLRRIEGVTVYNTDPDRIGRDGKPMQWKVYSHGGHVRGKLDGKIIGVPEAPKTLHVLECKSHNDKSFAELIKKKLKLAKPAHWLQCQKYMQLCGLDRCLYMAVNKNNDELYSERLEYDAIAIAALDVRLERIINSSRAPGRIAETPEKYPCLFCKHKEVCHSVEFGRTNCRTCVHSTPIIEEGKDATWWCGKHNRKLSYEEQRAGCHAHLFLPDVVPGEQVDAGDDWIAYTLKDGSAYLNQEKKPLPAPPREHAFHQCDKEGCMVCEGALALCTVCNGAEGSMPSECPGVRMTAEQSEAVYAGNLDYRSGEWIDTSNAEPQCDVCGGSRIEQISAGHGNVIEQPCSNCTDAGKQLASPEPEDQGTPLRTMLEAVMEPPMRYWWHPESDSLWKSQKDEKSDPGSELVEELTAQEYLQAEKWLASQGVVQ